MSKDVNVLVLSRDECIKRYNIEDELSPTAIISIASVRENNPCFCGDNVCYVLNTKFDDTTEEDPNSMYKEQAENIVEFCKYAIKCGLQLVVHCDGGVSRSAAIASAIEDKYNSKGGEHFWTDRVHFPNEHCYKLMREALDIPVSEDEINRLVELNTVSVRY